jgi:hypothetical protein
MAKAFYFKGFSVVCRRILPKFQALSRTPLIQ